MNRNLKTIGFVVSLIVYNIFFWHEGLGINVILFALLIITFLFLSYRKSFKSLNVQITLAGTMLTAVTVLIFNSAESKFAHIFSFLMMVAFIHQSQLRSIVYATMHIISSFFNVPHQLFRKKNDELKKFPRIYKSVRILRHSVLPLGIAFVFYLLYYNANPIFGGMADNFWIRVSEFIDHFFTSISFGRIIFILFGAVLLSVVYFKNEARIFLEKDLSFSEKLVRFKNYRRPSPIAWSSITREPIYAKARGKIKFKSLALKNQNKRGVILLILVNLLLFIVNLIDVKWLWIGFTMPEGFSLTHYVREGTAFLIISILFSIGLLLYYFRRNQNFYQGNKTLKLLAYVWIFQNAVLCFSIFLRNYHYIEFHGLAYRRIGVYAFLVLTVFGLYSLFYKIKEVRSSYFLVKINTWAVYVMLIALSFFNWDIQIANYNLAHWNKGEIDVDFYLKLSGKAYPVIYANLDKVAEQIKAHKNNKIKWIRNLDYNRFFAELELKKTRYLIYDKEHSWLSFNIADDKAVKKLLTTKYAMKVN